MQTKESDFYFDLSKFHSTMLTMRGSFMLLFQSILLSALAILFGKNTNPNVFTLLMWLGLFTSGTWWYMNYLTRIVEIKAWEHLLACDARVNALAEHRKTKSFGSISWLMAYPFPVMLFFVWACLLWCGRLQSR